MNNTIIIPVHEINEKVEEYLKGALNSIDKQEKIEVKPKILIVHSNIITTEITKFVDEYEPKLDIVLVKNDGNTDFQSQINLGADNVETDYFTILEFDDEFGSTYLKNVNEHITAYPDIDLFLPIIIESNDKRQRLKFTNETVWSKHFVGENGELGFLNAKSLESYTDFKTCGGVFKKEEFYAIGGFKSNIKLTFQQEFLLRMLNSGSKIYMIPKVAYMHLATREGGLFDTYSKTMTLQERKFWFEAAKREYSFFNDREIDMSLMEKTIVPQK